MSLDLGEVWNKSTTAPIVSEIKEKEGAGNLTEVLRRLADNNPVYTEDLSVGKYPVVVETRSGRPKLRTARLILNSKEAGEENKILYYENNHGLIFLFCMRR